ncbi:hypothetical protein [Amycolatopsis sp. NPDC004378]
MSGPVSGEQIVEMINKMHLAANAMIEGCREQLPVIERVDTDLLVTVKDLIADMHFLQVSLGILTDFYGRGLARSRRETS